MEILNCPLCVSPSIQTKCLLFSIKKKLKQLLNDYVPDFNEQEPKQSKNQHSFIQMLKIVYGDKYFSNVLKNKCNHQKICRYMKRKFKCDSRTFQQLCDHLSLKIGEKNYHFQILTSQIKTLSQTSINYAYNETDKQRQKIKTKETIEEQRQQEKQKKNLAENRIRQKQKNEYQMQNEGLQIPYQYYFPFGFYYTPFSSNYDQQSHNSNQKSQG